MSQKGVSIGSAVGLVLSLAVIMGVSGGIVTPPPYSELVRQAQAEVEIASYDSIADAVAAMKADSSIFQAKVGNLTVYSYDWSVNATSMPEVFQALVDTKDISEIARVGGSHKISDTRMLYTSQTTLEDDTVTVTGMIMDLDGNASTADTSDAAVSEFKQILQNTLNNAPEDIQSVDWTYEYEDANNGYAPVTKDAGTLTRGEASDDDNQDDEGYSEVPADDLADGLSKFAALSDEAKANSFVYIDEDEEIPGYIVQVADSGHPWAVVRSSVAEYVGKPVFLPATYDLDEVLTTISSAGDQSYLVFMGYFGDDLVADNSQQSWWPQAYAETIVNGRYILEVNAGQVTAVGIPDWGTISSETRTLITDIISSGNLTDLQVKFINVTPQDEDNEEFLLDKRAASSTGTLKSVITGMIEWSERPEALQIAEGSDFLFTFSHEGLLVIDLGFDAQCQDIRDNLGSFGGSYKIYKGESEYSVVDGAFQTSCPSSSNEHHEEHPAPTNDPNDRHASGENVPNEAKPQTCGASVPVGQADLFQIDRVGDKATIYFSPVRDNTDRYHVIFGNHEGDERYSGIAMQVSGEQNNGVLAIDIANLDPAAQYSFKVAPVNDCAVGSWSNWLTAKGVSRYGKNKIKTYRY